MRASRLLKHAVTSGFSVLSIMACFGQRVSPTASTRQLQSAQSQCGSSLKLTKLEENKDIEAAAEDLANQIVRQVEEHPDRLPQTGPYWEDIDAAIIDAMNPSCVRNAAFKDEVKDAATASAKAKAATSQTNKQNGAPTAADGSTSAAQKVGVEQLLGIAVEDGAISSKVSGTTMTLSTTPYGFATALGANKDEDIDKQSTYLKYHLASEIGISATFNIGDTTNPLTNATRKQVAQWQAKWTFRDTSNRSPKIPEFYVEGPAKAAASVAADISNEQFYSLRSLLHEPAMAALKNEWEPSLRDAARKAASAQDAEQESQTKALGKKILELLDHDPGYQDALKKLQIKAKQDAGDLSALVRKLESDNTEYLAEEKKFEEKIKDLSKGWNGDVSFSEKFPTTTMNTSATAAATSVRAAAAAATTPAMPDYLVEELDVTCEPPSDKTKEKVRCLPLGNGTLTGNFSGSFYSNPSTALNQKKFRGVQSALQLEWTLGKGPVRVKAENDDSKMTISLSGNYERLQENKDQKGKRPDIALGNIKLEIPISSGVSFPISFTAASSSEQIKESYGKGNFGISFDLDKLSALLKAKQPAQ